MIEILKISQKHRLTFKKKVSYQHPIKKNYTMHSHRNKKEEKSLCHCLKRIFLKNLPRNIKQILIKKSHPSVLTHKVIHSLSPIKKHLINIKPQK